MPEYVWVINYVDYEYHPASGVFRSLKAAVEGIKAEQPEIADWKVERVGDGWTHVRGGDILWDVWRHEVQE